MSHRLRLTAEKVAQRLRLMAAGRPRPRTHRTLRMERAAGRAREARSRPSRLRRSRASPARLEQLLGRAEPAFRPALALHRAAGWRNPALHLPLGVAGDIFTHPEALLYIDGHALASADRYHHTVDLDTTLADGQAP
jgi:alpha-mannosidase